MLASTGGYLVRGDRVTLAQENVADGRNEHAGRRQSLLPVNHGTSVVCATRETTVPRK